MKNGRFLDLKNAMQHCLWPNKNNHACFESALSMVLKDYFNYHERYQNSFTPPVTEEFMLNTFLELLRSLSDKLQRDSIPWASSGYMAHMNTNIPLPASLAYFAALLYNPNNVTPEASPITTELEYVLSDDFCRLFGMEAKTGWAHLTSGGHSANYEAIWIARNLKYIPLAIATLPDFHDLLTRINPTTLINLAPTKIVRMLDEVISRGRLNEVLSQATILRKQSNTPGLLYVAEGRHYAWDKCIDLLNIEIKTVPLDNAFRLDVSCLRDMLYDDFRNDRPVVGVVATVGSSGEGSVDDIVAILELKDKCESSFGASFFLHVDAAYGGYYRSLLISTVDREQPLHSSYDSLLKPEVAASLLDMARADTITVDPHKSGYVPYPAGCLIIRERTYSKIIAQNSKYFKQTQGAHMDFGPYTLEGARPGAAAAAVWMMHRLLGLNKNGYGFLLNENLRAARKLEYEIENASSFCAYGIKHHFRSLYSPDLGIINFAALPMNGDIDAKITSALTQRLTQNPLSQNAQYEDPWMSCNLVELNKISPNHPNTNSFVSVVRCCLMKPMPDNHQSEFWNSFIFRLKHRVLTFKT